MAVFRRDYVTILCTFLQSAPLSPFGFRLPYRTAWSRRQMSRRDNSHYAPGRIGITQDRYRRLLSRILSNIRLSLLL